MRENVSSLISLAEGWEDRWVKSTHKGADAGRFEVSKGEFNSGDASDAGLKTMEDYRFYQISAAFDAFSNEGKNLVFQFSAKHEQNIDCGGGYFKLMPANTDQEDFNGDSEYLYVLVASLRRILREWCFERTL